jgi:hypothetical protein
LEELLKIALTRNRISLAMSIVAFIGLTLILILNPGAEARSLSLAPIPYEMTLPAPTLERLTSTENHEHPGVTSIELYYQPSSGKSLWVGSLFYSTTSEYNAHALPDEVPLYGAQVKVEKGMSLSVIGAQEPYYDLSSIDRKRTDQINLLIYKTESFTRVK